MYKFFACFPILVGCITPSDPRTAVVVQKADFVIESLLDQCSAKWVALWTFQSLVRVFLVGEGSLTSNIQCASLRKKASILKLIRCLLEIKVARLAEAFVVAFPTSMVKVSMCVGVMRFLRPGKSLQLSGT